MPMVVPAPDRFSTTTLWGSAVESCWARRRATTSTGEPAVNGAIILIGRTGYLSASAAGAPNGFAASALAASASVNVRRVSIGFLPDRRLYPHNAGVGG